MKQPKFEIRRMRSDEIQLAIDWAAAEGWNPGLHDAQAFYQADSNGFFIGLLNNEPIVVGAAVCYDKHFAFCGLYIVKPEFRSQGYGIQLTHERLNYCGNRITGLDGVLTMTDKYANLGYREAHLSIRYQLIAPKIDKVNSEHCVDLKKISIKEIMQYEETLFPASREKFLTYWVNQPDSFSIGYMKDQMLQGYGVIRRSREGYKIGPLFANNPEIAEQLFTSLLSNVPSFSVYMDIPEPNTDSIRLAKTFNMKPVFEVMRMYRNGFPFIDLSRVYGITTFEIG